MSEPEILIATRKGVFDLETSGPTAFAGRSVSALAGERDSYWAVVDKHEIHRSSDGREWRKVAAVSEHEISCLGLVAGRVLVGTEEAHLYRLASEHRDNAGSAPELVESFESLDDRSDWFTPWGGPPAVRSIAWNGDRTVYVNVHVGGILKSEDLGESFEQIIDIKTDVHEVHLHRATGILLASTGRGFAQSDDSGRTWQTTCEGLHGCYMRAVAVDGGKTVASASNGPHGDKGAVYVRNLESVGEFSKCTDGLPDWFAGNVDTACVSARDGTVAVGAPRGSVYVSADGGATWDCLRSDLSSIRAVLIR